MQGYEIVFSAPKGQTVVAGDGEHSLFAGTIALSGGSITAWKPEEELTPYPNEILADATLRLEDNGFLAVDSEGVVNNLVIGQTTAGQGGASSLKTSAMFPKTARVLFVSPVI